MFANNLKKIIARGLDEQPPVFKTVASQNQGIADIASFIQQSYLKQNNRRKLLLTEKVYKLIQQKMMAEIDKKKLQLDVAEALAGGDFNLYSFVDTYV